MYELPPRLQGSEREQLAALRDYLVRMARDMDANVEKVVVETVENVGVLGSGGGRSGGGSVTVESSEAQRLRSLIIKTADTIRQNIDLITTILHEDYLAKSDFGVYRENIDRTIEETARSTTEHFNAEFDTVYGRLDDADVFMQAIRGEIRRGLITDPETGETVMGIAISENLSFTGQQHTENGLVYYELNPGQTMGLYTSTGWQFWINGSKRGWFNSVDGMLHISKLAVEQSLTLGAGWVITMTDGFGLRYIGG